MSEQPPYPPQYPPPSQSPSPFPQDPQYPGYPAQPPGWAGPSAPDGRPLADPGTRLAARIADGIVYAIVGATLAAVFGGGLVSLTVSIAGSDSPLVPTVGISAIVLILVGVQYVYEVEIPLRWRGQTPGKRAMKIAVVSIEPYGVLTRGRLTYRFLVMLGFSVLSNCYVGFVDPLWCLWDKPYRQCLHDKPAKTVVIRVQPS